MEREIESVWPAVLEERLVELTSPEAFIREYVARHGSVTRAKPKQLSDLLGYLQGQHLRPLIRLWGAFDDAFRTEAEELTQVALQGGWDQERYVSAVKALADRFGAQGFKSQYAATWYQTYVTSFGYNQAQIEMLRETPAGRLFPYLRFRTQRDERVRPYHRSLEGLVMASTSPLWAQFTPPLDWNCRCWLQKISWRDSRMLGLVGVLPVGEPNAAVFLAEGGAQIELPV
ncbi:MAG: minor capsid protein [Acidobacteria bacterium]|nr:minor capsid protein [Acidobacteriota bacterium]